MGKVLTVSEASEVLRVSPDTIRRWIREQRIPAYKAGKRVLLNETDVHAFIEPYPQGATA